MYLFLCEFSYLLTRLLRCLEFLVNKAFFHKKILEHLAKVPKILEKISTAYFVRFPQINYRPTNNKFTEIKGENPSSGQTS